MKAFAYRVLRSPTSPRLFNVVAVDSKENVLGAIEVDIGFDDAIQIADTYNDPSSQSTFTVG
jgi:hypothetical protein